MKLFPLITASAVTGTLYLLVIERDRLMAFAQTEPQPAPEATEEVVPGPAAISVVAIQSHAVPVDNAVVLRGRTEAAREVSVQAETQGAVVSEPLPKGSMVAAGDVLCRLDPGTRETQLDEAQARLSEAVARLPEAEAQIPAARAALLSAQARRGEAEARVIEARARLAEAEINQTAATRLSEGGFASDTRVANADATLQSALAGITSAEAGLQGAEAEIIRAEAGVQGALAAVESVRAGIQSAEAGVAAALREIERLTIHAPFDGILDSDTAELGSLLSPGTPCATIITLDPIRLVAFVPEVSIGAFDVGAQAGGRLTSGREVIGQVTYLSRSADEATRTFRVEIEVPNTDLSIRDGETAEILIRAEGQMAHLVQQSALTLDDDGRLGLRTVTADNTALFVPVTYLRDTVDGVWVTGLPEEVGVIIVGQEYVVDGVAVEPTWREANG